MPIFTSIGIALGSTVAASAAGVGAFGVGLAASAVAVGGVALQQTSAASARKAAKKATDAASQREDFNRRQTIAEANALTSKSSEQAKVAILDRQRALGRNQSVYTSPLGVTEQANTARKTLLGQ